MVDALLFAKIRSLKTLKPSPTTNEAFSELLAFCLTAQENDITLQPADIALLQEMSSEAENEMEAYWSAKISASKDPGQELLAFWYYANYALLVEMEFANASLIKKDMSTALFIGGGPLPLTAILLCRFYGIRCTIIEKDARSYELSKRLLCALGLEKDIILWHGDACDYANYGNFDLVYVAALVGTSSHAKLMLIEAIRQSMRHGSLLLCRHSHGARTLLYPSIDTGIIATLKPVLEIRPYNSIVNSFFILQKT